MLGRRGQASSPPPARPWKPQPGLGGPVSVRTLHAVGRSYEAITLAGKKDAHE